STILPNGTGFLPDATSVNLHDKVLWRNLDSVAHTVTSGDPTVGPSGEFDSGLLNSGASFEHTFDTSGTYDYFCMLHPWVTGTVQVSNMVVEKKVLDFIIPENAWCISPEEAQTQSNLYGLNLADAPICFTEITNQHVKAARSINIDNIIRKINSFNDEHFTNLKSQSSLINAAEDIRTLILSDKLYESLSSHNDFLDLIPTYISHPGAQQELADMIRYNVHILNPIMDDIPIPDTDGDGIPNLLDNCIDTQPGALVNTNGCSPEQIRPPTSGTQTPPTQTPTTPPYPFFSLVIAIAIIGIIIASREFQRA
ncbi:MAG: plastocyanin/azurin family copper-binding protein, partial [Nitrosarchaeum sp.]